MATHPPTGEEVPAIAIAGTEPEKLATFVDAINEWLSMRLTQTPETARMARIADAWDKFNSAAREVEIYNLERKPFVFAAFGWLADAARG